MPRRQPRIPLALRRLARSEAAPGLALMAAAATALIAANSPLAHPYHTLFHDQLRWTPIPKLDSLHLWINDGLMALFFFVVGLEIKRELLGGALKSPQARRAPVAAALGGMLAPAAIYLALTVDAPELARGWAIPAATDIAFAMGVLALAARGAPPSLHLFLLSVAIVDDLGAVAIIALFYTAKLDPAWVVAAVGALAALIALSRRRVASPWPFTVAAAGLWLCVLHSGLHATIAGVLAALTVPYRPDRQRHDSLLLRMEHTLVPWIGFVVVPVFGFANAGVSLAGAAGGALFQPLPLGIATGLVAGKFLGVIGALWLCRRTGYAQLPTGATWRQLWGAAALCGIGFTMSLFIAALAFANDRTLYDQAKLGILAGSFVAALAGVALLRPAPRG